MSKKIITKVAALLATVTITITLTGCVDAAERTTGIAVVVGPHANAAPIDFRAGTEVFMNEIGDGTTGTVVVNDGLPKLVFQNTYLEPHESAVDKRPQLREEFVGKLADSATSARADSPETSTLEAIAVATRSISTSDKRTILVFDSMLQTSGAIPMQNGSLYLEPAEVIKHLSETDQLPHLDGVSIRIFGLANVAAPQAPLDEASRSRLITLWTAVLEAAGAKTVTFIENMPSTSDTAGLPPVTPVEIRKIDPLAGVVLNGCASTVLPDTTVEFVGDSDAFKNPAGAQATIEAVAKELKGCDGQITFTGTTASGGTEAWSMQLSKMRARAAAAVFASYFGQSLDTMKLEGVGTSFPAFIEDRDANGNLVPELAQKNRSVIISITR